MYNWGKYNIINHYTYVITGDGDLQERVSQEASSLVGHLKLGKLIMLYDSNEVQLDRPTNKAYGWDYTYVEDGTYLEAISEAIENAKKLLINRVLLKLEQ